MKLSLLIIISLMLCSSIVSAATPHINNIDPSSAYNVGVTVITINGNNFDTDAKVFLAGCNLGFVVGTIMTSTENSITAAFNIKNIPPGVVDIMVVNKDQSVDRKPLFTILSDTEPQPTDTITTNTTTIYTTSTPGYSTTTAEPDDPEIYIYNTPVPTTIIPLEYRAPVVTTNLTPLKTIITVDTTIRTPTKKIITTPTQKSPINIIPIGIISLICILYIRNSKKSTLQR